MVDQTHMVVRCSTLIVSSDLIGQNRLPSETCTNHSAHILSRSEHFLPCAFMFLDFRTAFIIEISWHSCYFQCILFFFPKSYFINKRHTGVFPTKIVQNTPKSFWLASISAICSQDLDRLLKPPNPLKKTFAPLFMLPESKILFYVLLCTMCIIAKLHWPMPHLLLSALPGYNNYLVHTVRYIQ